MVQVQMIISRPSLFYILSFVLTENHTIQVSLPEGEDTVGQLSQTLLLFSLHNTCWHSATVLQALSDIERLYQRIWLSS